MSQVSPHPSPRMLPATAEEWFARRNAPDCSPQDEIAFKTWLRADRQRAVDYEECERLWRARSKLAANADLLRMAFTDAELTAEGRPVRTRHWAWAAGTMMAASLAALAWIVLLRGQAVIEPGTVISKRGELRHIVLADGSKVELNTDTVVVARISDTERRMVLERGEAFFDIVSDAKRRFIVEAGASEVRVVGTQFSVRQGDVKLEVIVSEGTVNVVPDARRAAANSERVELTRVELIRGNRLQYNTEQKVIKVTSVDPRRALAWRTGMIEFDNTTLEDAVAELNRYAAKPFMIEDEALRSIRVSGGFRVDDLDAARFAFKARFGIHAVDRSDHVLLTTAP